MTTLREAAQQALDVMSDISSFERWSEAKEALRAALAEPVQEPVAWMVYTEGGTSAYVTENPNDLVGAYRALALYTAPPQRKEQRLAESADPTPLEDVVTHGSAWSKGGKRIDPMSVYAEPVQEQPTCDECGRRKADGWALYCVDCLEPMFAQRKPLTEEEIKRIDDSTHFHESPDWSLRFARAIEQAHGIKP